MNIQKAKVLYRESTYFLQVIENEISFYLIKRRGYELEINRM